MTFSVLMDKKNTFPASVFIWSDLGGQYNAEITRISMQEYRVNEEIHLHYNDESATFAT